MTDSLIDKGLPSTTWPIQEEQTTTPIINALQDMLIDYQLLCIHLCPACFSSFLLSCRVIVKLLSYVVIVLYCSPISHRQRELEIGKVKASTLKEWANEEESIVNYLVLSRCMNLVSGLQYPWQVITDLKLVPLP